jgi:hypothetical protein
MGTRGPGRVSGMFLGSVAQKVISLAQVPIVLLKQARPRPRIRAAIYCDTQPAMSAAQTGIGCG